MMSRVISPKGFTRFNTFVTAICKIIDVTEAGYVVLLMPGDYQRCHFLFGVRRKPERTDSEKPISGKVN